MHKKNIYGMTLIEVLVAIAITSIIGLGLVSLQYILSQNQIAITKSYKSIDDANYIVSLIAKEIRMARESDGGSYLLNTAGDQEIVFYSDIDLDGQTEWVRYFLSDTNLIKEIIKPSGYPIIYDPSEKTSFLVTENVRNLSEPLFYYYNEDWPDDVSNNPLNISDRLSKTKTVKIFLRINQDDNPEKDYSIESLSQIRSAKENL